MAAYMGRTWTESAQQSTGTAQNRSTTRKVLDTELMRAILAGLEQPMTEAEMGNYARSLLDPQLHAGLEAAQQTYEAARQSGEQEKENLAASLARAIAGQQSAYRRSAADVETAALKRGMGRSSYTMSTLANQGARLAEAVRSLTEEDARARKQLDEKLELAKRQQAQTTGRLNADYAANLAAKVQELRQAQQERMNSRYMSAVSAALGSQTTGSSTSSTTGSSMGMSGAMLEPEGYTPGRLQQLLQESMTRR